MGLRLGGGVGGGGSNEIIYSSISRKKWSWLNFIKVKMTQLLIEANVEQMELS